MTIGTPESDALHSQTAPVFGGAPAPVRSRFDCLSRHRALTIAVIVLAIIVAVAIFAPLFAPHDPYAQNLSQRMVRPVFYKGGSWNHFLGTDNLGRDYLSRIIYGGRISLLIGLAAASLSCAIGVGVGVAAGFFGGRVDLVINFILTVRLSMPITLIILSISALIGGSAKVVIIILGCFIWDRFAVVTRSATQQLRNADFVRAARALGCSQWQLIRSDILPNIVNPIIVVATFEIAHAILLEASLSFLGLGVQPPLPSWGLMIAESREFLLFQPWMMAFPGIALLILCIAINVVGNGLRDIAAREGRG